MNLNTQRLVVLLGALTLDPRLRICPTEIFISAPPVDLHPPVGATIPNSPKTYLTSRNKTGVCKARREAKKRRRQR